MESNFLLQHKWGIAPPADRFAISKSALKKYLPDNAVMIDCGAHTGADSIELAKVFPKATIHSFEPLPSLFNTLSTNAAHYKNIKCYQLALSNSNSNATMFVSSGGSDASSSLLEPRDHLTDHPSVYFKNSIQVKALTLDQWAENNKIKNIDFLWLDMQGFEYEMLCKSTVILPKVKAIFTEVSTKESYNDVLLYQDFKNWLSKNGFYVAKELIPPGADMGNVLFVRN